MFKKKEKKMRIRSRNWLILQKNRTFRAKKTSLRRKKGFFGAKIVEKIEYKGQKLINFRKEKKRDILGGKKAGAELKKKNKDLLGQKLGKKLSIRDKKLPIFKKKKKNKGLFGSKKNKIGLSLRRKKTFFGPKIGKKIENKVQKLSSFKGKKDFFGQKKQAWAELKKKKKKDFLGKKLTN